MNYKVTDESIATAKRKFTQELRNHQFFDAFAVRDAMNDFCDALFVPQEEGWVVESDRWCSGIRYVKGAYQLVDYNPGSLGWRLYPRCNSERSDNTVIATNKDLLNPAEAQVWADQVIAGREASKRHQCPSCGFDLPKDYQYEKCGLCRSKPKPFGPGTRFRLPNGDEVRVIKNSIEGNLSVINLTTNLIEFFDVGYPKSKWNQDGIKLQDALTAAGAVVIEEGE